MRVHIKLNDKAVCGQKKRKQPLQFATDEVKADCSRCKKAVEK